MNKKTAIQAAEDRGFARGIAVACGIAYGSFGSEVEVEEILGACGFETRAALKKAGAEDYDLDILQPLFKQMRTDKRWKLQMAARP